MKKVEIVKDLKAHAKTIDPGDDAVVVCIQVADRPTPAPGGEKVECSKCNAEVWLHPNSPQGIPIICYWCAEESGLIDNKDTTLIMSKEYAKKAGFKHDTKKN